MCVCVYSSVLGFSLSVGVCVYTCQPTMTENMAMQGPSTFPVQVCVGWGPQPQVWALCLLDVCKRHGSSKVVLLDTGVAPLGSLLAPVSSWDVHTDHVPKVPLERPSVGVVAPRRGVGHGFGLHHGHDWTRLLGTATVGHGAAERERHD